MHMRFCLLAMVPLFLFSCDLISITFDNPVDPGGSAPIKHLSVDNVDAVEIIELPSNTTYSQFPELSLTACINADKYAYQIVPDGASFPDFKSTDFFIPTIDPEKPYLEIKIPLLDAPLDAGTYKWRVCAHSVSQNWGVFTPEQSFTLASRAINDPIPGADSTISKTKPSFSWGKLDGEGTFRFQISSSPTDFNTPTILEASSDLAQPNYTTTAVLDKLGPYYWRVAWKNADGYWSVWSSPIMFSIQTDIPTLISPVDVDYPNPIIQFNWSEIPGTKAYYLQVSKTDSFQQNLVDDNALVATSFKASEVWPMNDTVYYWRVSAMNSDGVWSSFSATGHFTLRWKPIITVLTPIDKSTIQDTTPLLVWSEADHAVSYEVQVADSEAGFASADTLKASVSQHQVTASFANGATKYWRVRPKSVNGVYGVWQGPWSFTMKLAIPELVSPNDGATLDDMTPTFTWAKVTDASAYQLQVSTDQAFNVVLIDADSITTTSYTASTVLSNDSTYYWRVRSKNADEIWSLYSNGRGFKTDWNPVITVSDPGSGSTIQNTTPLLDWSEADHAVSYEVQIADSEAGFASADILAASVSQHQVTAPFANGATKYWRIRPKSVNGVYGAWQGPWSFTIKIDTPIELQPDLGGPPQVSISGIPSMVYSDQIIHAEAAVSPIPDNYVWYLDSTKIVAGTVSMSLPVTTVSAGWHSLTCFAKLGEKTGSSSVRFQKTDAVQPSYLIAPANSETLSNLTPTFDWTDCADAQRYRIQIGTDVSFSVLVAQDSRLMSSSYVPTPNLTAGLTYYWRVGWLLVTGNWSDWTETRTVSITQ